LIQIKTRPGAESPQTLPHREKFHKRFFLKKSALPAVPSRQDETPTLGLSKNQESILFATDFQ
jgi:hypothetical protein